MGWTYYTASHFNKNGSINKKAEMTYEIEKHGDEKVLKASVVNNTYYAAVKRTKDSKVFAMVCLLHTSGWEFGYKDMDETMGPNADECPRSILKLLSPTTNEWALEWRNRCLKNAIPTKTNLKVKLRLLNHEPIDYVCKKAYFLEDNVVLFRCEDIGYGYNWQVLDIPSGFCITCGRNKKECLNEFENIKDSYHKHVQSNYYKTHQLLANNVK